MLLLDSTWPKVMMLSGFVRLQVKLTLELRCSKSDYLAVKTLQYNIVSHKLVITSSSGHTRSNKGLIFQ